jgi:hypothetical protein
MTIFIIHLSKMTQGVSDNPKRHIKLNVSCYMTTHPATPEFNGSMIECLNEITRRCPEVEFFERCTGHEIILTPTGEIHKYVEDKDCPIFWDIAT